MIIPTILLRIVSCTQPNPPTELQNPQAQHNNFVAQLNNLMAQHNYLLALENQTLKERIKYLEAFIDKKTVELYRANVVLAQIIENIKVYLKFFNVPEEILVEQIDSYINLLFPSDTSFFRKIPHLNRHNMLKTNIKNAINNDNAFILSINRIALPTMENKLRQYSGTQNQSSKSDLQSAQPSSEDKEGGLKRQRITETSSENEEGDSKRQRMTKTSSENEEDGQKE